MYDFTKLKARMVDQGETARSLAEKLGISENSMYSKLNGKYEFKPSEIEKMMRILNIHAREMKRYFFKHQIRKS